MTQFFQFRKFLDTKEIPKSLPFLIIIDLILKTLSWSWENDLTNVFVQFSHRALVRFADLFITAKVFSLIQLKRKNISVFPFVHFVKHFLVQLSQTCIVSRNILKKIGNFIDDFNLHLVVTALAALLIQLLDCWKILVVVWISLHYLELEDHIKRHNIIFKQYLISFNCCNMVVCIT